MLARSRGRIGGLGKASLVVSKVWEFRNGREIHQALFKTHASHSKTSMLEVTKNWADKKIS
jgi:hypothetical protein